MIAAQAFKPADLAMIHGDRLMACEGPFLANATIMRPIESGEDVTITTFAEFMKWHATHGWNIPGPFMAVSANLRERMK